MRKRKSLWDTKEDSHPPESGECNAWPEIERHSSFHGGRHSKFSEMNVDDVLPAERPTWESMPHNEGAEGNARIERDRDGVPGNMRAVGREDRHSKTISTSFYKRGRQNGSRSPDNSYGQLRRVRGGSKSPGRIRGRDRGWRKSRSRSRSRGRGRDSDRERSRSTSVTRSPLRGHRRESYGLSDKTSGLGVPSRPCRDFAVGKCSRGSHCRFFHQDGNHRSGHHTENDLADRRSKSEHGGVLEYGSSRLGDHRRDKVSDGFGNSYAEDQTHRDGRRTMVCKDFIKGNCRWGASCRYSHNSAFGVNSERVDRNASFDHEHRLQPNSSGRPTCKYFMMGKCHQDDCKLSHIGPTSDSAERNSEWGHNTSDRNKSWNGPTWGDVEGASRIAKYTGWSDSPVENIALEKQTDVSWGHNSEKESRMSGGPSWNAKDIESDNGHSFCGNDVADIGTTKFTSLERSIEREEPQLITRNSEFQTLQKVSVHIDEPMEVMRPKASEDSCIQPLHGHGEDIVAVVDGSNAVNRLITKPPAPLPGHSLNQNDSSVGPQPPANYSGINHSQGIFSRNASIGDNIDLNGIEQGSFSPMSPGQVTNIHTKDFSTPEMLGNRILEVTCQNVLINAPITSLPTSSNQISLTVPSPLNTSGLMGLLPVLSSIGTPVNPIDIQPNAAASYLEQNAPVGVNMVSGNDKSVVVLSNAFERRNQFSVEQSSSLDSGVLNTEKLQNSVALLEEYHNISTSKQLDPLAKPDINGNNDIATEKGKQDKENVHSGKPDADAKVEEGNESKDEKGMRLFKIALVEFVKEILKPTWKEGQMSREVHKSIVKKVVDKVTGTLQGDHMPKSKDKVDQYLSFSKPKIMKLVQAYVDRSLKK